MITPAKPSSWRLSPWVRMVVLAVGLTAVLVWMVVDRMVILKTGTAIVLKARLADPRDLFRGYHVALRYEISSLTPEARTLRDIGDVREGDVLYVLLRSGGDGFWHYAGLARTPASPPEGAVYLRGEVKRVGPPLEMRFGLERYYAPKDRAAAIERFVFRSAGSRRDDAAMEPFGVIVRVTPDGRSAIAGLVMNGETILDAD